MPAITPEQQDQIRRLHKQGLGRNQIAQQASVSAGYVTSFCKAQGLTFDRTSTEVATAVRTVDLKARRKAIIARLYDRTETLLTRLEADTFTFRITTATYSELVTDKVVPGAEERAITGSISTLLQQAVKLEEVDSDDGAAQVTSMLVALGAKFGLTPSD